MLRSRIAFLLVLALPVLFNAGCPTRQTLKPAGPAQLTVEAFLHAMVDDDEEAQWSIISPSWLDENDIEFGDEGYFINGYGPTGFVVTGIDGDRVTVLIQFEDGAAHQLEFLTRVENGRGFIVPGSYDEETLEESGWIHPWLDVIENVR